MGQGSGIDEEGDLVRYNGEMGRPLFFCTEATQSVQTGGESQLAVGDAHREYSSLYAFR